MSFAGGIHFLSLSLRSEGTQQSKNFSFGQSDIHNVICKKKITQNFRMYMKFTGKNEKWDSELLLRKL